MTGCPCFLMRRAKTHQFNNAERLVVSSCSRGLPFADLRWFSGWRRGGDWSGTADATRGPKLKSDSIWSIETRTVRSAESTESTEQESHLLDNPQLSLGRKPGRNPTLDAFRKAESCARRLFRSVGVSGGWHLCRAIHGAEAVQFLRNGSAGVWQILRRSICRPSNWQHHE